MRAKPCRATDARGNVSVTLYDKRGLAVESRSPDGTVTRTAYDAQGRAYLSTDPFVPGQAEPVRGTETVYDAAGRAVETRRRVGVAIAVTAGAAGPSSAEVDSVAAGALLSASATEYDAAGRAFRSTQFVGVAGAEAITTTLYDGLGRAVGSKDALGHGAATEYDVAGRVTKSYDAAGVWSRPTYDGDGRAVRTTLQDGTFTATGYDGEGRKAYSVDAVGQATEYGYDPLGRLVSIKQPAVVDPADSQLKRPETTYGYDAQGNRTTITDANGRVTTFHFDEYNRPTGRTLPAVPGEPAATDSTVYDQYGAVDYAVDFLGTVVDTVYDYDAGSGLGTALGRVARVTWTRAGQATPEQAVAYTYDALGRADLVTESAAGQPNRVTDTDYDGDGRVVKITRPEGVIEYGYQEATGRHITTTTADSSWGYGYDVLGRLSSVTDVTAGLATAYAYDVVGNVLSVTTTQGATVVRATTNSYDPVRHWLDHVENKAAGVVVSDFTYARRDDGQVEEVTESVTQPGGGSVSTATVYTYDALNRLTSESVDTSTAGGDFATAYTLDRVGNRTQVVTTAEGQPAAATAYTHDARDRLLTEASSSGTIARGYDAAGSLTTQSGGGQPARTLVYDARGRLTSATVGSDTSSYRYSADGVRSGVTTNGASVDYVLDGMTPSGYSQVVEEHAGGVLSVRFTYGAGLDPLSESRDGASSLYLADGHSGVRQAVSVAGAVVLARRYDAYGVTVAEAGTPVTPIGYRGERLDGTLGQVYLRARLYDPASGRFNRPDPFGGTYGDPLQAMRYGYAGANPVMNSDPSGMMSLGGLASGIGVFGGLAGIGFGAGSVFSTATGTTAHWWENFIPGWGSGRNYATDVSAGNYGSAAFNAGLGILDLTGIGWAGTFLRNTRLAKAATNSAVGRIASQAASGTRQASVQLFNIAVGRLMQGAEILSSVGAKSFPSGMAVPNFARFAGFLGDFGIRIVDNDAQQAAGLLTLGRGAYAGTAPVNGSAQWIGQIIYRNTALNAEHNLLGQSYVLLHELAHAVHLTLLGRVGGPSGLAWRTPESEQFVFDTMRIFFWDGLTEAQKRHATNYARQQGASQIW